MDEGKGPQYSGKTASHPDVIEAQKVLNEAMRNMVDYIKTKEKP